MSELRIESLRAGYGDHAVLDETGLVVPSGELVALLGPSGCGKTTLLRVVAGLHRPTSGRIVLGERTLDDDGSHVPTHRRRITLVPQEAALFPHLDVAANVAFGTGDDPAGRERVEELLELVGLSGLGGRSPHQLSGGQQQRVALARALAPRPQLVLLDEPFSSLDALLREQLRGEVKELLERERATALLVTHDQQEALSLADQVAVMRAGRVSQQSPPGELYTQPHDTWTARFVGDSVILSATAIIDGSRAQTPLGIIAVTGGRGTTSSQNVMLRPEQIRLVPDGVPGVVRRASYHGHDSLLLVELDDGTVVEVRTPGLAPETGTRVALGVEGSGWMLAD